MQFLEDFKKFIARGNVIDLAVGIIIGAAFTSVVKSLVDDIIMPAIGLLTNGVDFSNLYINLTDTEYATLADAQKAGAATINYGLFINAIVSFLIVSWAVFLIVKAVSKFQRKAEDPKDKSVPTPRDIALLTEIRDLLASRDSKISSDQ